MTWRGKVPKKTRSGGVDGLQQRAPVAGSPTGASAKAAAMVSRTPS
ncbi:hypothetical protein [Streptomyces sp. NPDC048496]